MNHIEAKIVGMLFLGVGSIATGLSPIWFSAHSNDWPLLVSSLLCFGGGVLFSTSLIHMLPELREGTEYAELLLCAGFFVLYLADEIVHYFWSATHRSSQIDNRLRSGSHSSGIANGSYGAVESAPLLGSNGGSNSKCETAAVQRNSPSIGQLGLLVALSVHALLEGLAVGLEDKVTKVWLLVGAVASHKLVVAFCLGVELSSGAANTTCKHVTAILIFTFGTIGGIAVGMLVTSVSSEWTDTVQPILQGLAAGTLLYATVSEVLPRERTKWHNQTACRSANLVQLFAVLVGFGMMTLITTYLDFDN